MADSTENTLPEPWSADFMRLRPVRIALRKNFPIQPQYASCDGRIVNVHHPRIMESAEDGGHSLYSGDVCWDIDWSRTVPDEPNYLSEKDFVWIDPSALDTNMNDDIHHPTPEDHREHVRKFCKLLSDSADDKAILPIA